MSLFNGNPDPVSERPFFKSKTPLPGSVAQYFQGAGYFIKGITFLKKNPSIVKYLVFPFLFSAALYALMFFAFFLYSSSFVSYILPASDHTFLLKALWYILFFFVNVFVLIVMLMTVALVTNIIASPFYDHVSLKIEGLLGDEQNSSQEGKGLFWEASRMGLLLREEAKKSLFILLLPVLVALIPLIGPVLAT
ncbi:MAG: EI24 domain-containing protein, partial [Nitrospinota bacterium]